MRCLELARVPGAAVEPNPRVGAVVVHQDRIIGEGAHLQFGGPHAEVHALASVQDRGLLRQSSLYVSLEPCNHHGKTPPCTEAIIAAGIPRVVIGALDPNPRMQGKSVDYLRNKGIDVVVAPENADWHWLNRHFHTNQSLGRPYVVLKWAESKDGFVAGHDAHGFPLPMAISSPASNRLFHGLRHELQAIWIGNNTARIDNPSLTTRLWPGRNPVRIVFDLDLSLPKDLRIFQTPPPTIVINGLRDTQEGELRYWRTDAFSDLPLLLGKLYAECKVGSVLVEGGPNLTQQFLDLGLWDELYRCISPQRLADGVKAPVLPPDLKPKSLYSVGVDAVEWFLNGA